MKIIKFLVIFAILFGIGYGAASFYYSGSIQRAVIKQVENKIFEKNNTTNTVQLPAFNFLEQLLGVDGAKYYLILFLNNTELRPGGGFIGTYGVIKVDKAVPEIIKTDGTEFLDYSASDEKLPDPPDPLSKYLLVKRWYFRDSNWSPDFKSSAEQSLQLFTKEGGVEADKISGVIGFTPTAITELLKITGPLTVNNMKLDSKNFLEQVQYQVEYGYGEQGIPRRERKDILGDLAKVLMEKTKFDFILNWSKYYDWWTKMIAQKQIMLYSNQVAMQGAFEQQKWSGELASTNGDYILWADANLGALKTDWILERTLNYSVRQDKDGRYVATVKMHYEHPGSFDWRTTRYRTYARVYVPLGSKLIKAIGAMDTDRSTKPGKVDEGTENNRQWFGAFISIEPKRTGDLSFEYYLPPNVIDAIAADRYSLYIQKQLGAVGTQLKLDLNFGKKKIIMVNSENWEAKNTSSYPRTIDLSIDRMFDLVLK